MNDHTLFITDLPDSLEGAGMATVAQEDPTTLEVGEEGDEPTTMEVGEEGEQPTTMATGEEGDDEPTTMVTGEEGDTGY